MGLTIAEKIIQKHLVAGEMIRGSEVGLRIDQTLTQDATGTMAYLEFEAMGLSRVQTELSVAYIDHNTLQCGFENADDHAYIRSVAKKYGVRFSMPGNGICHQVHLERFGIPGKTLIGSDSHTPTGGGLGMLAFGAGGLDVAVAMGGGAYYITMPKMYRINLKGSLRPFVSAKDVALEALRLLSVKGGVGAIIEWGGEGVKTLTVQERATITNMGAELGATTSVFPSDEMTRKFLAAEGREADYTPIFADEDAVYDKILEIDMDTLAPLVACPHMPDCVKSAEELAGLKVDQVCIGSCTNSSLPDMLKVAALLKGKTVAQGVSLSISPGSRQVLSMLISTGALNDMIAAGARILVCACGPSIGMGFSPPSGGVSLRTFNRNFEGRSGTADAKVYLVSPETAVAAALSGVITDPRALGALPEIELPESYAVNDSGVILPAEPEAAAEVEVLRGPNIGKCPIGIAPEDEMVGSAVLKVGDDITTDHIMPAGAKILPFRSNIPYLSRFCFGAVDPAFAERAKSTANGMIIGGANYGQGSSREHAALVPLYLGIRAVIAKSFSRIHMANLINAGILPLTFANEADYELVSMGDKLTLTGVRDGLVDGKMTLLAGDKQITLTCSFTDRQRDILLAGGLLPYTKAQKENR